MEARTVCPLDCYGVCGLRVMLRDGRVSEVRGDPAHPVTRGVVCAKVANLAKLANHPERLLHPLRRTAGGSFAPVSWQEALDAWAEALAAARDRFGPTAVLHYTDSGSSGLLKALPERFFARFGGATVPQGSLCFAAGLAAQTYDFGTANHHDPADLLHAGLIVVWGHNPVDTNVHTARLLREARRRGIPVVLIDPVRTRSAALADRVLQPRPGTDAALAQALARELIVSGRFAAGFIAKHSIGFSAYRERVLAWTFERAAAVTGVEAADLRWLADLLAARRPVAFLLGWGLQRYRTGGATVRAIDALGAVAGSIGVMGGGVSYAHRHWKDLAPLDGRELPQKVRRVRRARLGEELALLQEAGDPPLVVAVVARANPACQAPDSARVRAAFGRIPFKVVIDHFLTDTAELADLVLPAANSFEEEDVYVSSWTTHLGYGPALVAPPGECRTEQAIYRELAERLGMEEAARELARPAEEWLAEALAPLGGAALLTRLRAEGAVRHPRMPAVPFADGRFPTPSGKLELWSEAAAREGRDPLGGVAWPWPESGGEGGDGQAPGGEEAALEEAHPYRLLSPQPRHRLHSIFGNLEGPAPREEEAYLHPLTAQEAGVTDGGEAVVFSSAGELRVRVRCDEGVRPGVVVIPNGAWRRCGGSVNLLTQGILADMGDQAALYEARCGLRKAR
ncbi:MAG TPA: molybdopterin-dependent oxidoreductase [Firmicutes bacterium]|nr:molybdopterin-dependent oxidoreductase [Bacillota bacterium]